MGETETGTTNGWPRVHTDRLMWVEEGARVRMPFGCCLVKKWIEDWDLWCLVRGAWMNDCFPVYVGYTCWACSNSAERTWKHRAALLSPGRLTISMQCRVLPKQTQLVCRLKREYEWTVFVWSIIFYQSIPLNIFSTLSLTCLTCWIIWGLSVTMSYRKQRINSN